MRPWQGEGGGTNAAAQGPRPWALCQMWEAADVIKDYGGQLASHKLVC